MSERRSAEDVGTERTRSTGSQTAASWLKHAVAMSFSTVYWNEFVELFRLAGPVTISQSLIFLIGFVSTVFCGHLGKTELASVALAIALVNVSGIAIGIGLSLTCDTLISQTYGSGNLKRVGIILQRSVFILLLACFPCWAFLINTEPLLLLVKQSPDVASLAQLYVNIFMPALPEIIWPQVITGAIGNVLNAVINYVLLYTLDMGVVGSAAASAITQYLLAVILSVYIIVRGLHKPTWPGWSLDSLQEWGPFLRLAIPSMMMLCLEFWVFELGVFLAGLISEVELGAQSVVYQLIAITFMIPLGLAAAASVRVGNALGAGNIDQAKLSSKVPIISASLIGCVVGALMIVFRHYIGFLFTKEREIIERVSEVALLYSFMLAADAVAGVSGGVLRGLGKQKIGAVVNLVGYYLIGLSVGVSLMFAAKMGIVGLGIGITVCVMLLSIVCIVIIYKLDWQQAVNEAQVRAGVQITDEVQMTDICNETVVTTVVSENGETPNTTPQVPESPSDTVAVVGPSLPLRTLFIRRGLALLFMVLILCAAIIIKMYLLRLLKKTL